MSGGSSDRVTGEESARHAGREASGVVEVPWHANREPRARSGGQDPSGMKEAWPLLAQPSRSLAPRAGHAAPDLDRGTATVMIVTLFGLETEKIAAAVANIERHQRAARNFVPLFLTDNPDTAVFLRAGFNFEYFPRSVYCGAAQGDLFQERFLALWKKWGAGALIDFSKPGFLEGRIENYELFVRRDDYANDLYDPRKKRPRAPRPAPTDVIALRAEYQQKGLHVTPDSFVLYRILGNDLPPRHEVGQTLNNLRFMLENEPPLERCEKRWVVNRIIDPAQEAAILALLAEHGQPVLHIPFRLEEYAEVDWDLTSFPQDAFFLRGRYSDMNEYDRLRAQAHSRRFKNGYVINNNGARNAALRDGLSRAKWVLPWDGNCFLTAAAWNEIIEGVMERPYLKYFTVPMSRTLDNAQLLDPDYRPPAEEEPQILFRCDAQEEFDETFYYGRRPKVELFYRLGIRGNWDNWADDVWDRPRAERSGEAGATGSAGWVARLYSGQKELEEDKPSGLRSRGEARISAITQMLDRLDVAASGLVYDPGNLVAYDEERIRALGDAESESPEHRLRCRLIQEADLALQRGPYSVVDKTFLPPSGNSSDYYNPAPYWWPNPATPNGMPFVFRDGERVPGTRLYEPESDRYDRTRLQRLFDEGTMTALAWVATGQNAYIRHTARLVRHWFVAEDSRMNPHLLYSQVRSQTLHDHGSKSGLIEMKDLYYFLDAVRLAERSGELNEDDKAVLRGWFTEYLDWLQTSDQGVAERHSQNNHGTCYDLQTAAIASYLGDAELLQSTFRTSRERMLEQFTADGRQPHEMKRTQTAHYCCFNLQGWVNLANLAEACGDRLWYFEAPDGRGLARAFGWLLPHLAERTWKYQQIEPFDRGRFLPLFFAARERSPDPSGVQLARSSQARAFFFPHDGIKPFWMLGRKPGAPVTSGPWGDLSRKIRKLEAPVFELCHGRDPRHEEPVDIRVLDKKLWGGFSRDARAELEAVRNDPDAGLKDMNRAARVLARSHFTTGDYAVTLDLAASMRKLGVAADRERGLLRAYCQERLGDYEAAERETSRLLSLFPGDANLCVVKANIRVGAGGQRGDEDGDSATDWVNRIFRRAGLADLLGAAPGSGDGAFAVPDAGAGSEDKGADTPLVSVILRAASGARHLDLALRSLRAQTFRDIEILVTVAADCPDLAEILPRHQSADSRIKIVTADPGAPPWQVRSNALAGVSGRFVVLLDADRVSHPALIEAQVAVLEAGDHLGALPQQITMTEEGHIAGGWFPEFSLISDSDAGLMLPTETLLAAGGWDAVERDPDAFLRWRLKRLADKPAFATALPGVPLSVRLVGRAGTRPTHLDFPYGHRRDQMRRLMRAAGSAAAADGAGPDTPEVPVPPLGPARTAGGAPFDAVFVGDFSRNAVAVAEVGRHILDRIAEGGAYGLFHWPDYHRTWSDDLDEVIAEAIDEDTLTQISAFQEATASALVLCSPYGFGHALDGFPDFRASNVQVLCGPEQASAEFFDGHWRRMPMLAEIEERFQCPAAWVSL